MSLYACEKVTTVIPPSLKAHLQRLAREQGFTLSYFVRRHLEASFSIKGKRAAKKGATPDKAMKAAVDAFIAALSRSMKTRRAA